jgi:hypothetical protein
MSHTETVNPNAVCFDQTDVYRLQKQAISSRQEKGHPAYLRWHGLAISPTSRRSREAGEIYTEGKGSGLEFSRLRSELTG